MAMFASEPNVRTVYTSQQLGWNVTGTKAVLVNSIFLESLNDMNNQSRISTYCSHSVMALETGFDGFQRPNFQGWEFAHLISERIVRFLSKNERMSALLKKMSDSLIRSFLVSEMSNSLISLISSEQPERVAHGPSFLVSKMSDSLTSLI